MTVTNTLPAVRTISQTQELILSLIRKANRGKLIGWHVTESLQWNQDLWIVAAATREKPGAPIAPLRGIEHDEYQIDTIWVIPAPGREAELTKLAETWDSDGIEWSTDAAGVARMVGYTPENPMLMTATWCD